MKEDDSSNARFDTVIGSEEQLTVEPPILLSVLGTDALEAFGYTACGSVDGEGTENKLHFFGLRQLVCIEGLQTDTVYSYYHAFNN